MNRNLLINAMYTEILETYGTHSPFETKETAELESCFEEKHAPDYELSKQGIATDAYEAFREDLVALVWGNIRNAFEVGFNCAVQLLMGGSMV